MYLIYCSCVKTSIRYIANNLYNYLKQNTEKLSPRIFFRRLVYIHLDYDPTILGKTTIQVLSYRSFSLLCKVCSVVVILACKFFNI